MYIIAGVGFILLLVVAVASLALYEPENSPDD